MGSGVPTLHWIPLLFLGVEQILKNPGSPLWVSPASLQGQGLTSTERTVWVNAAWVNIYVL